MALTRTWFRLFASGSTAIFYPVPLKERAWELRISSPSARLQAGTFESTRRCPPEGGRCKCVPVLFLSHATLYTFLRDKRCLLSNELFGLCWTALGSARSEEHTSELQSPVHL